jgi:hypothetical protein
MVPVLMRSRPVTVQTTNGCVTGAFHSVQPTGRRGARGAAAQAAVAGEGL